MLYQLCDAEELIELYAVEAHSLDKSATPVECEGVRVCPESKPWDVTVARPEGLSIKMQGVGHSSRLLTKANNTDSSLAERQLQDSLYAEEAIGQGWSVLWLWVDERISCPRQQAQQWAAQLKRAMVHVTQRAVRVHLPSSVDGLMLQVNVDLYNSTPTTVVGMYCPHQMPARKHLYDIYTRHKQSAQR
jgi:hypothetical protein